jgi:gas vesicle protein
MVAMAGVALVAGAAGCALGLLAAPASGKELRRRLAWRAEEELRGASRAGRAFVGRAVTRAREELANQRARVRETAAG